MNFLALNDDVKFIIASHLASDLKIRSLLSKNHGIQKKIFNEVVYICMYVCICYLNRTQIQPTTADANNNMLHVEEHFWNVGSKPARLAAEPAFSRPPIVPGGLGIGLGSRTLERAGR